MNILFNIIVSSLIGSIIGLSALGILTAYCQWKLRRKHRREDAERAARRAAEPAIRYEPTLDDRLVIALIEKTVSGVKYRAPVAELALVGFGPKLNAFGDREWLRFAVVGSPALKPYRIHVERCSKSGDRKTICFTRRPSNRPEPVGSVAVGPIIRLHSKHPDFHHYWYILEEEAKKQEAKQLEEGRRAAVNELLGRGFGNTPDDANPNLTPGQSAPLGEPGHASS